TAINFDIHTEIGTDRLCDRELGSLHAPRAQVFANDGGVNVLAELPIDSCVGASTEILMVSRSKQQITSAVACDESGFAPRAADSKIEGSRKISGMQVLLRERSCLSDNVPGKREPIPDGAARHVHELTKQVLVHGAGVKGVATNRELQTRGDAEAEASKANHRINGEVEDGVQRVSLLDQ